MLQLENWSLRDLPSHKQTRTHAHGQTTNNASPYFCCPGVRLTTEYWQTTEPTTGVPWRGGRGTHEPTVGSPDHCLSPEEPETSTFLVLREQWLPGETMTWWRVKPWFVVVGSSMYCWARSVILGLWIRLPRPLLETNDNDSLCWDGFGFFADQYFILFYN